MGPSIVSPLTRSEVREQVVRVVCGPTREIRERLAGWTVAAIRAELEDALDIPPGATAILNGRPVKDEKKTVVPGAAQLEYIKKTGVKG